MTVKNFDVEIKNFEGEAIKDNDKLLLMRMVISTALNSVPEQRSDVIGVKRAERGFLAQEIYKGGDIDLKPEQLTLIKEAVGSSNWLPLVVAQVYAHIDA